MVITKTFYHCRMFLLLKLSKTCLVEMYIFIVESVMTHLNSGPSVRKKNYVAGQFVFVRTKLLGPYVRYFYFIDT
jgi:hypothetical protein